MKIAFYSFLLTAMLAISGYSQNITNTLGSNGTFIIWDGTNTFLTVDQATGLLTLKKNMSLPNSTSSSLGVILKGTDRFIHDYQAVGTLGKNTFVGTNSGNFTMAFSTSSIDASWNTGIGYGSMTSLTSGFFNTALGNSSLSSNTSGNYNTAAGVNSLKSNTTGESNTSSGYLSLYSNTTGSWNTAFGSYSMWMTSTGIANTAIGYYSLTSNTTGSYNTALGNSALFSNTTGGYNIASGFYSMYTNTTGYNNVASGDWSLHSNTSGYNNTAIGYLSMFSNVTGFSNTVLGNRAGYSITTGSNLTCIGDNSEPSSPTAVNEITLGNASVTVLRSNITSITSLSDARDKKNIKDLDLGIDFLMKITPRLFNWDKREWYDNKLSDGSKMQKTPTAGFIAQELDKVQMSDNAGWLNLVLKDNPERFEATPGNLLPIIVKAIQDLKKENDELKTTNEELRTANNILKSNTDELADRLVKFEKMQTLLAAELEKLKTDNNENIKVSLETK